MPLYRAPQAFLATKSAIQNTPGLADVKVTYPNVLQNTGIYDPATSRINPLAGRPITITVSLGNTTGILGALAGSRIAAYVFKNGANLRFNFSLADAATFYNAAITITDIPVPGDYYEAYCFIQPAGATVDIVNGTATFFSAVQP